VADVCERFTETISGECPTVNNCWKFLPICLENLDVIWQLYIKEKA
jgi:hypothetical protein